MSKQQVAEITTVLGAKPLDESHHPRLGDWYAARRNEKAWFAFDQAGNLQTLAFTWAYGLMGVGSTPRTNLCSGLVTVGLTVTFDERWKGFPVFLDGAEVCRVGEWRFCEIPVPLGSHTLEIRYDGGTHVEELIYEAGADGNPRRHVK